MGVHCSGAPVRQSSLGLRMVRTQFWLLSLSARIHSFSKYVLSACSALDTPLFCYLHILHFSLTALIGAVPSLHLAILSGHQFQSPVSSKLQRRAAFPPSHFPSSPLTPRMYPPCSLIIFPLHLLLSLFISLMFHCLYIRSL